MTQDEIIRMAREAGMSFTELFGAQKIINGWLRDFERFAALVAESTCIEQQREIVRLKAIIEEQANGAQNLVLAEREAVLEIVYTIGGNFADECAAAIRARS